MLRRCLATVLVGLIAAAASAAAAPARAAISGQVVRPVDGPVIQAFDPPASPYGPGHRGVDLAAEAGTVVRSAAAGTVTFSGLVARRGWVTVDHGGGLDTTYGVLEPRFVRAGQRVIAGEPLGRIADGAVHLDWGARLHGRYIDPLWLLARWELQLVRPGRQPTQPPPPPPPPRADGAAVLGHPRIALTANARADLQSGVVDERVVAVLLALAARHEIAVSVIKTGHSRCVGGGDRPGCRVSNHWYGRAVDIHVVDGRAVGPAHPGARSIVAWTAGLRGPLRPHEVGSPFADWAALPGWFTDDAHRGHLHIGYRSG